MSLDAKVGSLGSFVLSSFVRSLGAIQTTTKNHPNSTLTMYLQELHVEALCEASHRTRVVFKNLLTCVCAVISTHHPAPITQHQCPSKVHCMHRRQISKKQLRWQQTGQNCEQEELENPVLGILRGKSKFKSSI